MENTNVKNVENLKIKILIIIGIAMIIEGFSSFFYSSYVLFSPTKPPFMKPVEGADFIFLTFSQALLYSGIAGGFVTLVGILLYFKERKRNGYPN